MRVTTVKANTRLELREALRTLCESASAKHFLRVLITKSTDGYVARVQYQPRTLVAERAEG